MKKLSSYEAEMAEKNCILKVRVGSKLYGTNGPDSDDDYVGIFIADLPYYIGLKKIDNADLSLVDKDDNGKNTKEAVDIKYYELREFIKLAMENNPNILEVLFVNKENIMYINPLGKKLLANAHLFPWAGMERKFLGYAKSQKHKMVIKKGNYEELTKAHEWLNSISDEFANKYIAELRDENNAFSVGNVDEFMHFKKDNVTIGDCSFQLNIKLKKLRKMIRDRVSKIGNREELYLKYGYDTKFASHLIRLLCEGLDLAKTCKLEFPIWNHQVKSIKEGRWDMKDVLHIAEEYEEMLKREMKTSNLSNKPKFKEIEELLMDMIMFWFKNKEEYIIED